MPSTEDPDTKPLLRNAQHSDVVLAIRETPANGSAWPYHGGGSVWPDLPPGWQEQLAKSTSDCPTSSNQLAPAEPEGLPTAAPSVRAPFGGVQRRCLKIASQHQLARKMDKLYKGIEHHPKMDNKTVRKRNQRLLAKLYEGVLAGIAGVAYNVAELHYNGAPGIAKDLNKTLELYVTAMEAPDSEEMFTSSAEFADMILANMLEVIDCSEMAGIDPIMDRLQAICDTGFWMKQPPIPFVVCFASARQAFLHSKRAEAAALWREAIQMRSRLTHPLHLRFVVRSRKMIAVMQNTLDHIGDDAALRAGRDAIDMQIDLEYAKLEPATKALPQVDCIESKPHQEPNHLYFMLGVENLADEQEEAYLAGVKLHIEDHLAEIPRPKVLLS